MSKKRPTEFELLANIGRRVRCAVRDAMDLVPPGGPGGPELESELMERALDLVTTGMTQAVAVEQKLKQIDAYRLKLVALSKPKPCATAGQVQPSEIT